MVDSTAYPCRIGTLLWVRPGQVYDLNQNTGTEQEMIGTHIRFTTAFASSSRTAALFLDDGDGPVCRQLGTGADYAGVWGLMARLDAECGRSADHRSRETRRHLLAMILLNFDRSAAPDDDCPRRSNTATYYRFRLELERSFTTTHRVEDYAAQLGYSVRTLTRACLAAVGEPAKQVIDNRVRLEAERLLAHTTYPVASIARRLGFSQPTNFGRFFSHHTGTTPTDFRSKHRRRH